MSLQLSNLKQPMRYDYLLAVGPGRSGTSFLYENLKQHPAVEFLGIKEGYYYRSLEHFGRIWKRVSKGVILADISNRAYCDPLLIQNVKAIKDNGYKVLIILSLRDHYDRAISAIRFRKSRGEFSTLLGRKHLEEAVVRDRLMPAHLLSLFQLEVDVLIVCFPVLTQKPEVFLECLSSLCQTSRFDFDRVKKERLNESVQARNLLLSTLGKTVAVTLRHLGSACLVQRLKGSRFVNRVFFVELNREEKIPLLSDSNCDLLKASYLECCSIIKRFSDPIGEQIYFRKVGAPLPESANNCPTQEEHPA